MGLWEESVVNEWTQTAKRAGCSATTDGWEGLGGMIEGDEARAVRGKVSGVGLIDGESGSWLSDMIVSADVTRKNAREENSRLCLRASAVAASL